MVQINPKKVWGRRAFLKGLGGVAVGLPLMASLPGRARAEGEGTFPKRLVIFFSPNGTIKHAWRPALGETNFQLGRILAPLEPYRDKLLILSGIDMQTAKNGPGDGHQTGMGHMLTATELLEGDLFEGRRWRFRGLGRWDLGRPSHREPRRGHDQIQVA